MADQISPKFHAEIILVLCDEYQDRSRRRPCESALGLGNLVRGLRSSRHPGSASMSELVGLRVAAREPGPRRDRPTCGAKFVYVHWRDCRVVYLSRHYWTARDPLSHGSKLAALRALA
jgi:hypothetical protein